MSEAAQRSSVQELGISRELFPFEGHHLNVGGHWLHYLDEGPRDAPVLLMLHGNPTWSFYYRDLVLELRETFRCVVPDHIGCGLSDKPATDAYPYTLAQRVDDLQTLLDHLEITGPLTLVVHDWGGGIGMTWAARQPERVQRFVVFNTAGFHLPKSKPFPWPLALTRTPIGAALVRRFNAFSAVAARVAFKKKVSAEVRRGYQAPCNTPANRVATLRFVQDIPLRPEDSGYDLITAASDSFATHRGKPALICWGLQDFVFDHQFLREWCERWPDAEVHRFEDCGHYILEDAGEQIRPLVREFLARTAVEAA